MTKHERFGPRGKNMLLDTVLSAGTGAEKPSAAVTETLKACLQCGACSAACPAGVDVRGAIRRAREHNGHDCTVPSWVWEVLAARGLTPFLARIISGFPGGSGIIWRLTGLSGQEGFTMPDLAQTPALSSDRACTSGVPLAGKSAGLKISVFVGCVQNYLYPEVVEGMFKWFGGRISIPRGQICCGMPAFSSGDREKAVKFALRNISVFREQAPDYILTGCATCASMIRNWAGLVADVPEAHSTAVELGEKVREFSRLAWELAVIPSPEDLADVERVTFHAPCHQRFELGGAEVTEDLLQKMLPGKFTDMTRECCGQGGLFSLGHPELSGRILQKRFRNCRRTGATVLLTTCSGCLLQLRAGAGSMEDGPQILHIAELVNK